MDPLVLGSLVALVTVLVLFSGVSVAVGLLIVTAAVAALQFRLLDRRVHYGS